MTRRKIDPLGLSLELPNGFVQEDQLSNSGSVTFCFEPQRIVRFLYCFSLEEIASLPNEEITQWNSDSLAEMGIFYYRTQHSGGGSGGEMEVLEGYLLIGERTFQVEAVDQREFPAEPDATWVLPIITTVRSTAE